MKTLVATAIALALFPASALLAQGLAGTWQGTLKADRDLRTVVTIPKADGGGLQAVFYSIDQSGHGTRFDSITLEGVLVR
jgi:hypothetical protein